MFSASVIQATISPTKPGPLPERQVLGFPNFSIIFYTKWRVIKAAVIFFKKWQPQV
jgi:hypothetical protein